MQVDFIFENARVYNVEKVDVVKGQAFSIYTDQTGATKWFSDNDPVLALTVKGNSADVKANETGSSEILIMDENKAVLKTLSIKVVDQIEMPATDLNTEAGEPVIK